MENMPSNVVACLEERLGADIANLVASGVIALTATEKNVLKECGFKETLNRPAETISSQVVACLEERLGAEIANLIASRAIALTATEKEVLKECLLRENLNRPAENSASTP